MSAENLQGQLFRSAKEGDADGVAGLLAALIMAVIVVPARTCVDRVVVPAVAACFTYGQQVAAMVAACCSHTRASCVRPASPVDVLFSSEPPGSAGGLGERTVHDP